MPTIDSTRPEGVKVTTAAMVAVLVVELILSVYTMHRMATLIAGSGSSFHMPTFLSGGFSLIGIVIAAVFVVLYWQGSNVGRWAVLIDSGIVILSAFISLFSMLFIGRLHSGLGLGPVVFLSGGLNLLKACLAGYFFWYLNQPEVKAWFLTPKDGTGPYPPQGYVAPYAQPMPAPYSPVETVASPPTQQAPPPPPPGFTV